MRTLLSAVLVTVVVVAAAGAATTVEAKGKVDTVTLYRGQALVTRVVPVTAPAGAVELTVTELPEAVQSDSLFASGGADLQVRAVRFRSRALGKAPKVEVQKLDDQIAAVEKKIRANSHAQQLVRQQNGYLDNLERFVAPTAKVEMAKGVLKDIRVDCARFWEDMAYKSGTLISPDMIRKYMLPRYKQITDYLRSQGVNILHADSDGNINELIPLWMEVGINFPWPLEVAAGMDGVALRKKCGKDIIIGGNIDKRVFAKGKDAVHEEVMSKVPYLVETGPYFPCLDHVVPPDVPLDGFRYYINLLREIAGREKLPE